MSAQMPNQAVPFSLRATEIDQQQPAVRLENADHFADAKIARAIWKAMEDRRAQHDVECRLGERQRLSASQLEVDFGASSCRLFARASDHLSRCVQPEYPARRADSTFGNDGERPRSAADIQHRFVSPYSGVFERFLAISAFRSAPYDVEQKVVCKGPPENSAARLLIGRAGRSAGLGH